MSCLFYLLAFHHWVWLVWAHSSVCVCMCVVYQLCWCPKFEKALQVVFLAFFKMAAFHALTFLFSLMDSADSPLAPLCKCCEQNHSHFSLKCCCFAAQSGRVGPVASGLPFLQQIRIILFALMGGLIIPWVYGGGKKVHYFICPHCFYIRLESVYLIAGSHFVFFPLW